MDLARSPRSGVVVRRLDLQPPRQPQEPVQEWLAQIDVQLNRRYDLIPNLVETAKGYMAHERETLEAVIAARSRASTTERLASADPGNAQAVRDLSGAETGLTGALGRLFAVAERYPDLKADQTMIKLMEELSSTRTRSRSHGRGTTMRS